MTTASVVVIGAGVVGASVAYHLAARGMRDVLVLERSASPGGGSTRRATGGFRLQFETPVNVHLSRLARAKLLSFPDEFGVDPGYRPVGYLWLATDRRQMEALRRARTLLEQEGVPAIAELDRGGVARLNPAVDLSSVVGGTDCRAAGFIEPLRILDGYLAVARRLGVRIECDAEIVGFTRDGAGRIRRVRTTREEIPTELVVNAAGAWAGALAALAGVELPVTPLRRQVAVTHPFDGLPEDMPMTIFCGDGFHLRVRGSRVLLLLPTPGAPEDPFDTTVDPAWLASVRALAERRVPLLRETAIDESACYAGLYEMTPDEHAVLGAAAECPNLYLVNGSSGHGVMHAPALGQLVAELVTEGSAHSVDITALRPTRFAEGRPNRVGQPI